MSSFTEKRWHTRISIKFNPLDRLHSLLKNYCNPAAPGAGKGSHFRLSKLISKDREAIATNAFFQN